MSIEYLYYKTHAVQHRLSQNFLQIPLLNPRQNCIYKYSIYFTLLLHSVQMAFHNIQSPFSKICICAGLASNNGVLNNNMGRNFLIEKIDIEIPISLFFKRIGEAESFVELGLQEGIGAEAGLDDEELGRDCWISVENRNGLGFFLLVLLRGGGGGAEGVGSRNRRR